MRRRHATPIKPASKNWPSLPVPAKLPRRFVALAATLGACTLALGLTALHQADVPEASDPQTRTIIPLELSLSNDQVTLTPRAVESRPIDTPGDTEKAHIEADEKAASPSTPAPTQLGQHHSLLNFLSI